MRYNTIKSYIIIVLSSAMVLTLFVCGAQPFVANHTSPAADAMHIAKGQVYKPPKDIYREQC